MELKPILIAAFAAVSLTASAYDDWAQMSRYASANEELMADTSRSEGRVVFMGNSITDMWPTSHAAFFEDNNFAGRGISGQTTYQMLLRFNEDVVDLHPAAVVINGGTNDIAENNYQYDEHRTFGNIKAMAEIAAANGIKVILASVLPSNRFKWRPEMTGIPERIESLNKLIKALAEREGYAYIDYHSRMVDAATGGMIGAYSEDGVHPNAEGYAVMESVALPIIRSVVPK